MENVCYFVKSRIILRICLLFKLCLNLFCEKTCYLAKMCITLLNSRYFTKTRGILQKHVIFCEYP
jgi:hypothetical protein